MKASASSAVTVRSTDAFDSVAHLRKINLHAVLHAWKSQRLTKEAEMALFSRAALTTIVTILLASSAFAQSTAPATTPKPEATKSPMMHSATSIECSKEADTKGLHGKERKKFRAECKRTNAKAK